MSYDLMKRVENYLQNYEKRVVLTCSRCNASMVNAFYRLVSRNWTSNVSFCHTSRDGPSYKLISTMLLGLSGCQDAVYPFTYFTENKQLPRGQPPH